MIGIDHTNSDAGDGDLDDIGDEVLVSETFASEDKAGVYDHAGNLVDDGNFIYEYDAPALDSRLR